MYEGKPRSISGIAVKGGKSRVIKEAVLDRIKERKAFGKMYKDSK